jgi:hypothetical protein
LVGDFVDRIYPIEHEIKDTTDTAMSASYLDLSILTVSDGLERYITTKEMISILGSVAYLLAATLYQGSPDRNHKLWNIGSIERYIIHIYAGVSLLECWSGLVTGNLRNECNCFN